MNDHSPAPTLVPKVFRFNDIDAFRSFIRNVQVECIPLAREISAEQTILNLPGCDLNYTKAFPRVIDVQLAPNTTAVGFPMDEGAPIRFNGVEHDRSLLVIGSGGAAYSALERTPRQYASIVFEPTIEDRSWPKTGPSFNLYETSETAKRRLRQLVREILAIAPHLAEAPEVPGVAVAIRESLMAAIDHAFAEVVPVKWMARANAARQFKVFKDVQAVLSSNVARPIYSSDLAREVGVSVRTMHDAVQRYRGMSLHRYLRLRRLWLVRQHLLAGAHSVKACALAYGFWHLSDFSRIYRSHFGESPSETLSRSRRS